MGTTSLKEINENGEEKNEIRVLVGYFCSLQVLGHFEEQKSPDLVDLHNACGNRENGKADNSVYRHQKIYIPGLTARGRPRGLSRKEDTVEAGVSSSTDQSGRNYDGNTRMTMALPDSLRAGSKPGFFALLTGDTSVQVKDKLEKKKENESMLLDST
jgi:hypothetical protein